MVYLLSPEHCCLCGVGSPSGRDLKPKVLGEITSLLEKCQIKDGAVYDILKRASLLQPASVPGSEATDNNCAVCTSCSNWLNRLGQLDGAFDKDVFIPMDCFLWFLCGPGDYVTPDKRAVPRLVEVMTSQCPNLYSNLAPPYVHTIPYIHAALMRTCLEDEAEPHVGAGLDYTKTFPANTNEQLVHAIVIAWWKYNGHALVFTSSAASKLVRRALDRGKKMHLNDPVMFATLSPWLQAEWTKPDTSATLH